MKKVLLPLLSALAAACLVPACVNDSNDSSPVPQVLVHIVDTTGAALGADTVYWSYQADGGGHAAAKAPAAAHGDDTTTKAAKRLNASGTQWAINHEGLHGVVFVRAAYDRNVDPFCFDYGYKQIEVNADALPKEVVLELEVARFCE